MGGSLGLALTSSGLSCHVATDPPHCTRWTATLVLGGTHVCVEWVDRKLDKNIIPLL
jgi:hypothetical protein